MWTQAYARSSTVACVRETALWGQAPGESNESKPQALPISVVQSIDERALVVGLLDIVLVLRD